MITQVDLIITTRNRADELKITLDKVLESGFEQEQIYLVDDASTDGTADFLKRRYPRINVLLNEEAKGYIANRNYLMNITRNKYVLSLDDDSCFRSKEDVEEAIQLLESDKTFGIFTFYTFEQLEIPPTKEKLPGTVRQVRTYIGCGHIIKREVIESLGKYVEDFEFYCEELDYSLRAIQKGYKVITQDNLVVHHRVDWKERDKQFQSDLSKGIYGAVWRSTLGFSNNLLVVNQYYPPGLDWVFKGYYILLRFIHFFVKKHDHKGFLGGLSRYRVLKSKVYKHRGKLNYALFNQWVRLPVR